MSIRRRLLGDVIINLFQAFDRGGQDHGELSTSSCFLWGEKKTHYQKREQIPFIIKTHFQFRNQNHPRNTKWKWSLLWGYILSFLFLGKPKGACILPIFNVFPSQMIKKDLVPILINSYENIDVFSAVIRSGKISKLMTDLRFVNNFTPPDFQAKILHH